MPVKFSELQDAYELVSAGAGVRALFQRRGAYGRFKAWLAGRRALDAWYAFETDAEEAALRAWCADEGLELSE